MLIDCDICSARPRACGDCVVTHLLGVGSGVGRGSAAVAPVDLDSPEIRAVAVLAAGGLLPPLRLVTGDDSPVTTRHDTPTAPPEGLGQQASAG